MTLLAGVLGARNSLENPEMPISSSSIVEFIEGGKPPGSGIRVSEIGALNLSAVYRAVTFNAGVAASLPLDAYRKDGKLRLDPDPRAQELLDDPHPDLTPFEFWEIVYCHLQLWGNAYLRILRTGPAGGNRIKELWAIHPSRVRVGRTSETGTKVYEIDGGKEDHTDATILHIPAFGYDGICGVSPIRLARESIGLGLAAEQFGGTFFANGSLATGVLQVEQRLTADQADKIHERWQAKQAGLKSGNKTIVLDGGAKFERLTIPPEDAQFLETRRFQTVEIGRWFGLPPFLMYETEKSTSWGTGLEQQSLAWVMYDLRRLYIRPEQRLTKLLRAEYGNYATYAIEGLLRGDSKARAEFYTKMWNIGVYSTNDIREKEDEEPVEGGDVRYRPLNMGILGEGDTEPVDVPDEPATDDPDPDDEPEQTDDELEEELANAS